MDVISILGPSSHQRHLNQDEFDARFNYASPTEKDSQSENREEMGEFDLTLRTNASLQEENIFRRLTRENWKTHRGIADYLPGLQWAPKYGLKTDLPRDLLGSLLLAALFLPQAVTAGVLAVDNAFAGIYAFIVPQILYPLFGSSRHSSLGAVSFVSLLVHSSSSNAHTSASALTFVCAMVHLSLALIPLESLLSLVPDPLLSGFAAGLSLRLVVYLISHSISIDSLQCGHPLLLDIPFSSIPKCILSSTGWLLLLSLICLSILLITHYFVLHRFSNSIPVTPPFQLAVMLASIALSYTLNLQSHGVKILKVENRPMELSLPNMSNFTDTILDGIAIGLFGISLHLRIVKTIAIEKMHTIDRKQELLAFASFELPLSFLGLPPIGSAHGKAQLNVETARFSLLSFWVCNIIAVVWISFFVSFAGGILRNLPYCVVAGIVFTSFPGVIGDIRTCKRLSQFSSIDTTLWLASFGLSVIVSNMCKGFLLSLIFALITIVLRVHRPTNDILIRLSTDNPAYFAEEDNYAGEAIESPAKVFRFNAPLLFANCDVFRRLSSEHAKSIKGALALGLGTRTASLRSQIEPKESVGPRNSKSNIANIIINQEPSTPPNPSMDSSLVRVLIVDCSAITDIDSHGIEELIDMYFELQEQCIRVIFAAASVRLRRSLQSGGFFSRVSRSSFYPTLIDAHLAARHALLPIHMSVSMNGYRDVIALSSATSDHDQLHEATVPPEQV